jgi:hypothetical protein
MFGTSVAVLVLLLFAADARAQGCPNPSTGPLAGSTGEYCFSQQEGGNIDFTQPVFMTTNIGPQGSVTTGGMRKICTIYWENPTCWFWIPPPGFCCGSVGRFTGCGPVFLAEYCLSMSQPGQAVMAAAAANCPVPTMPPPIACGATRVICVQCPGPAWMYPCEWLRVPVKVPVTSNVTFIDCQDFANYTDLGGQPQSKMCFHVRQKCVDECVQGTPVCATSDASSGQMFGCFYVVPVTDWSNTNYGANDIPADGVANPDAKEVDPPPDGEDNDDEDPVNPGEDGGWTGAQPPPGGR